ncbi:hypothetical protein HPP92_011968 [Vanilla planifolia]|uniref:Uncharacterized protein n=1 Tax=Vanilla planifolia TaxID=51239 RepID=A0A835R7Y8_VANPL|nr:hypothetical protein HPP92_011968 [Vanilla planifolia]
MAKHRNKKKNKGGTAMDISVEEAFSTPQEVDISDPLQSKTALGAIHRTFKKGRLAKRSKNLRKQKAIEKAVSNIEKSEEKVFKVKTKALRVQSAKSLYE